MTITHDTLTQQTQHSNDTVGENALDEAIEAPAPADPPTGGPTGRRWIGWAAVGVAIVAVAGLTVSLVGGDSSASDPRTRITDAKDHPGYRLPTATSCYEVPGTVWRYCSIPVADR